MVQVSYPGVYIVEKPSGVHTITGVSTSITAFLGQALKGPVNKPVRLLSFSNFEKTFGKPCPGSELSTAVRLFFQNGGSDCYVVRLIDNLPENRGKGASVILKNQDKSIDVLKFVAKEIGTGGNEIALEVDYNTTSPQDTFHMRTFRVNPDGTIAENEQFLNCTMDPESPRFPPKLVTQNSKLVDCELVPSLDDYRESVKNRRGYSESRWLLSEVNPVADLKTILEGMSQNDPVSFGVSIDNSSYQVVITKAEYDATTTVDDFKTLLNGKFNGSNVPSALKGVIEVTFRPLTIDGTQKTVMRLQIKSPSDFKRVSILPGSTNDITKVLMFGTINGGIEETSHAYYRPAPNGIFFELGANNQNLDQVSEKKQDFFNKITLAVKGKPVELELGTKLVTNTDPNNLWYKADPKKRNEDDGIREKFAIIAEEVNAKLTKWTATLSGSRLLIQKKDGPAEDIPEISTTPKDIGSFFQTNCRLYSLGGPTSEFTGDAEFGKEGQPPKVADYKGDENEHTGLFSLDYVDLFNILVIPDDQSLSEDDRMSLWAPASVYCKNRRAFLLTGAPRKWSSFTPQEILDDTTYGISNLRRGVVLDHSAVYHPRIIVPENGVRTTVEPTGAIAGIMARTDATVGVWKAPAGLNAGFQGDLFDVEALLTDPENGILNEQAVNCLRLFPSGLVCWGARTLYGADEFTSEWKYIPVRRLALFIEETLYRGTKFAVFEPNDEPLWAQLRSSVTAFMRRLYMAHAFQGSTEDEAFFVKCDNETTTPDDQNLGIVNIQVGFAPLKPAEFVVITIQQMAGET